MFVGHFCPPGSGSYCESGYGYREQGSHWIRIQSGFGSGSGSTALNVLHNMVPVPTQLRYKKLLELLLCSTFFYWKSQLPSFTILTVKLIFATLEKKLFLYRTVLSLLIFVPLICRCAPNHTYNLSFLKKGISNLSFSFGRLFTFLISNKTRYKFVFKQLFSRRRHLYKTTEVKSVDSPNHSVTAGEPVKCYPTRKALTSCSAWQVR